MRCMPTYAHSDAYACVNVYEYLAILERKKERSSNMKLDLRNLCNVKNKNIQTLNHLHS